MTHAQQPRSNSKGARHARSVKSTGGGKTAGRTSFSSGVIFSSSSMMASTPGFAFTVSSCEDGPHGRHNTNKQRYQR